MAASLDIPTVSAADIAAYLDAMEDRRVLEKGRATTMWKHEVSKPHYIRLNRTRLMTTRYGRRFGEGEGGYSIFRSVILRC